MEVAAGADGPLTTWRPAAAPTAARPATVSAEPTPAELARPGWTAGTDRERLVRASAGLHRHLRALARAPLLFRLRAQATREREQRRQLPAHAPPGVLGQRLDAFLDLRLRAEEADLTATAGLLAALDDDGLPGSAAAADSAALAAIAADLRRWLAEELHRREAATAPGGLRLVAFHRAALAEAWRTAAKLVAGAAGRAHWQIWLPDGDGGWAKREQDARAALPAEAQAYVRFIEQRLGVPVRWIGTGPGRDEIVAR